MPGYAFHRLWGGDEAPRFPDEGTPPEQPNYFPPPGGFRFGLVCIPPGETRLPPGAELVAAIAEGDHKLPGLLAHSERDEPGMHTTPTIDFEVVLSGECVLELDDGVEAVLHVGDTVVQNGTRHRWHNRSLAPCQLVVFAVGAHHDLFGT